MCVSALRFFFLFVFITELPSMEFDLHLTGTSVILHLWLIYSVFCTSYLSDQTKHVVMVWWLLIHPVQCCGHGVIWTLPERLEHDSALSESFFLPVYQISRNWMRKCRLAMKQNQKFLTPFWFWCVLKLLQAYSTQVHFIWTLCSDPKPKCRLHNSVQWRTYESFPLY